VVVDDFGTAARNSSWDHRFLVFRFDGERDKLVAFFAGFNPSTEPVVGAFVAVRAGDIDASSIIPVLLVALVRAIIEQNAAIRVVKFHDAPSFPLVESFLGEILVAMTLLESFRVFLKPRARARA
jgi:hypothetical protein